MCRDNAKKYPECSNNYSDNNIGVAVGTGIVISIINMTSPAGIWPIINLFQMLMLLILTGAFIPEMIKSYLIGMNFVLFNFNFIPLYKVPIFSDLYA